MQKIQVTTNRNSSKNHGLDEELAKQLDHRKQEKQQWLQNPNHKNAENVENIGCKSSKRHKQK